MADYHSFSIVEIQGWLEANSADWCSLRKPDFLPFFNAWRDKFEPLFAALRPTATDVEATEHVLRRLPADVLLFCAGDYRYMPAASAHPFFALKVEQLRAIDVALFNRHDVVLADLLLSFSCMYSHEAGIMTEVQFWDAAHSGPPQQAEWPRRRRRRR